MPYGSDATAAVNQGIHPSTSDLADFVAGQTQDPQATDWIETHLATCPLCCDTAVGLSPDRFEEKLGRLAGSLESDDRPAHRLGPGYELVEVVGSGGSGVVYRARQPGLQREVAFKTLRAGATATPLQLARFRYEALAISRVHHPHVVEIYDMGDQDGAPFLVMEFVRGKTLAESLRTGPLEFDAAVDLMIRLADAVECVHRQGILHRDVKPQNVLLQDGSTRHPKLADFGLSHLNDASPQITHTGDPLGTPGYMAPETIRGDKRAVGATSDVYGLGAILYECLAGQPPFRRASPVETMEMVLHQDPVPLHQLRVATPQDLQTICQCSLEKDPSRRYATAAALRDDLTAFQQRCPIAARPRSTAYRIHLWLRRNPWPATWLATVAAAILVGLIFLSAYQHRILAQRDRANQRYADARRAIWSVLQAANHTNSFQIPKLGELTLEQARHALLLFEKLAGEDDSNGAQRDLARIRMHVGTLLLTFGKSREGEELLAQASHDLRRLASNPTRGIDDLLEWTSIQTNLAIALVDQGRFDDASRIIRTSLGLSEEALAANPENIRLLEEVARLQHENGNLSFRQNNTDEMKKCVRQAVAYRIRALAMAPGNRDLIQRLAESRINLAQAECQSGQLDVSEREFRAAIDVLQPLTSPQHPNDAVLVSLATARLNLSNVLAGQQEWGSAVECCSRGIAEVESVLRVEPHQAIARSIGCQLFGNRALYRAPLGQSSEVLDDWTAAVEMADNDNVKAYCRIMKVRSFVKSGQLSAADSEAARFDTSSLDNVNQFRIAAMWGLLGNAMRQTSANRGANADRADLYHTRAAAMVADLVQPGGYLRSHPADAQYVAQSDDFCEVRLKLSQQQLKTLSSAGTSPTQQGLPEAEE